MRARCLILVPFAVFFANGGANSPNNPWTFETNFFLFYAVSFLVSFAIARHKRREPRMEPATLPRAQMISGSARDGGAPRSVER